MPDGGCCPYPSCGLPALLLTGYADGNIVDDVLTMELDPITLLRKAALDSNLKKVRPLEEGASALLIADRDSTGSDAGMSEPATC